MYPPPKEKKTTETEMYNQMLKVLFCREFLFVFKAGPISKVSKCSIHGEIYIQKLCLKMSHHVSLPAQPTVLTLLTTQYYTVIPSGIGKSRPVCARTAERNTREEMYITH